MAYANSSDDEMKEGVQLIRLGTKPDSPQLQAFMTRLDSGIHAIASRILRQRCADPTDNAVVVVERVRNKLIERRFPNYDEQRPFWPWIGGIVWQACNELLRRDSRRSKLLRDKQNFVMRGNPCTDPHISAGQRELQQLVRAKLKLLPKHYRVAVKARDLRGWSRERTARWCKVTVQTVSNWQFHGKALLAQWLVGDYWGDADQLEK